MEELLKEIEREYGIIGYAVTDSFRAVPPAGAAGREAKVPAVIGIRRRAESGPAGEAA
jgi:hypothetical protein